MKKVILASGEADSAKVFISKNLKIADKSLENAIRHIIFDPDNIIDWDKAVKVFKENMPELNSTDIELDFDKRIEAYTQPWDMNDEELNDYQDRYVELESKMVPDSDGFMTDYTMYRDTVTGNYVFMFGDKDVYSPEEGYFDWECDSEQEAYDWFYDYSGIQEDDEILSDTELETEDEDDFEPLSVDGFMSMFEITVDLSIREQAAEILYRWYTEEGEDTMPTRNDVLDMCDAATNEHERIIVLQALDELEE